MSKKQDLFNRYDANLGFSYRYAAQLAFGVLADLEPNKQDELLRDLLNIFAEWKFEHGVYETQEITLMRVRSKFFDKQRSAKENMEKQKIATIEAAEKLKTASAWECAGNADTPLKLFYKLVAEEYQPLKDYLLGTKIGEYEHFFAMLIVLNNDLDSARKSADCIEGALMLAKMRMETQTKAIDKMTPLAKEAMKKRLNARIQRRAKKEQTEREIMDLHTQFQIDGQTPPLKEYAVRLGVSISTISRHLKKNGIDRYK